MKLETYDYHLYGNDNEHQKIGDNLLIKHDIKLLQIYTN